jgi:hypothetical protein
MPDVLTQYEERRGWTTRAIVGVSLALPGGVACFVGFAFVHTFKLLILGAVCALGVINLAGGALSRRVVLRVDETGITLLALVDKASSDQLVPWAEVRSIVLYKPRNISMLGIVKSYAGVPAKPLEPGRSDSPPTPDISAALDSWRVDVARLKQVVGTVAPNVEVLDRR